MSVSDGETKQTATTATTTHAAPTARPDGHAAASAHDESPVVAKVRGLLERGLRDPAPYAEILRAHPAHTSECVALLHTTLGNAQVGTIIAEAKAGSPGAAGPVGKVIVHAEHGLRVRSSPALEPNCANVIGVLPDHQIVEATGRTGDWLAIDRGHGPAFVHAHYVAPADTSNGSGAAATKPVSPTAPDEATPVPANGGAATHAPDGPKHAPTAPAPTAPTGAPDTTAASTGAIRAPTAPAPTGAPTTTPVSTGAAHAPLAPAPTASADTMAPTGGPFASVPFGPAANPFSTPSTTAAASSAGAITIEQLRTAVAGNKRDDALADYRGLDPAARIALRADVALCVVGLLAAPDALAVLGDLALDRAKTLSVGAYGHFVDGEFLISVLHLVKLDTIQTVAGGAADLNANPAYLAEYIMAPILDGARVTAADQHALARTGAGVALLQTVYSNKSPLVALTKLAANQALLRDAAMSSSAFADWLFTDAAGLEARITQTAGQGVEWVRAIFGSPRQEQILIAWMTKDPSYWGNELALGFSTPAGTDAAALRARPAVAGAIYGAIATAQSVESLIGVFVALGLRLPEWIEGLDGAHHLTEASLALALEGPSIGPAEQGELAEDSVAVALVRRLAPKKRPSEVLTQLVASPKAYFDALAKPGAFASWVIDDPATLLAEARGLPNWFFWVAALQALDNAKAVLQLAAAPGLAPDIAHALTTANAWSWFFVKLPQLPVPEADAQTLWKLWDVQGAVMTENALHMLFSALYTVPMRHAGQEVVLPQGGSLEDHYHAVDPSKLAMQRFFERYRHMPRAHVDAASQIAVCDYYTRKDTDTDEYLDDKDPVGRTKAPYHRGVGAMYTGSDTNTIIMEATWTLTTINQDDFKGLAGEKAGAVNRSDPSQAAPNMTFFENHAIHEVGHAIGARTNPKYKDKIDGNAFAREYANWGEGNAKGYARMLGFTSSMDGKSYSLRFDTTKKSYDGDDIREFLTGIVEGGLASQNASKLGKDAGSAKAALAAVGADPELSGTALYKTVAHSQDSFPGAGWQFPLGINGETKRVHMYNGGWQAYDAAVFIDRVSSYSTSASGELFAEIYTEYYSHGKIPKPNNGHSPKEFLDALNNASPEALGIPVTKK